MGIPHMASRKLKPSNRRITKPKKKRECEIMDLNKFNTLSDLCEDDQMLFPIAEWLDLMINCSDRVLDHCTLAHRACDYNDCPGCNTSLNGS